MALELPSTPRIVLRRVRLEDAAWFDQLDHDEGVLRYIQRVPHPWEEQHRTVREILGDYERHPLLGRFVAESPAGEFLGWFGLVASDRPDVPELGYRLRPRFWGQGLATEGSLALLDHAFRRTDASAVEAETMFVNTASRRVMVKCGLSHVRTYDGHFDDPLPGTELGEVVYRITRAEWTAHRTARFGHAPGSGAVAGPD